MMFRLPFAKPSPVTQTCFIDEADPCRGSCVINRVRGPSKRLQRGQQTRILLWTAYGDSQQPVQDVLLFRVHELAHHHTLLHQPGLKRAGIVRQDHEKVPFPFHHDMGLTDGLFGTLKSPPALSNNLGNIRLQHITRTH